MAVGPSEARQFRSAFSKVIAVKATVDFASAADDAESAADVTVPGAALGDFVLIAPTIDVTDAQLTATVTAANTVTAVLSNVSGSAVDLASQTLHILVLKPGDIFEGL